MRGDIEIEELYNSIILLGLDYVKRNTRELTKEVIKSITAKATKFTKKLPQIFLLLQKTLTVETLSQVLCVSKYFLDSINSSKTRGGFCNICGLFKTRLREHLIEIHSLTKQLTKSYAELFSNVLYFYMPLEHQILEEEDGLFEKFPKNKRLENAENQKKLKKQISDTKAYTKTNLDSLNCIVCGECGKIIPKTGKYEHVRNHKKNEIVECDVCHLEMKVRNLPSHKRVCEYKWRR